MSDFGDVDPNTGTTNRRSEYAGTPDPYAPSVANGRITPEEWAAYEAKRRRDALFGALGVFGMTTGLGAAGAALGGGGAASSAGAGGLPPIAGGSPWPVTPYATTATMNAPGAMAGAAGVAGSGAAAAGAGSGLSARDWLSLGLGGAGLVGGALGTNPSLNPSTATMDPNLSRLLEYQYRRLQRTEPLQDSILAMANALLPIQYQHGPLGSQGGSWPDFNSLGERLAGRSAAEVKAEATW